MRIVFALGLAMFAVLTAILVKCGIKQADSTVAFSYIVFKEKLSKKAFLGLLMIVAGTLAMLF